MPEGKKETRERQGFDASAHLTNIRGKDYLEVKWRLVWFHEEYGSKGWCLITKCLEQTADHAFFSCVAVDDKDRARAMGHGYVNKGMFPRFHEKAETAAIGRCLAILGLGTQFAEEMDEDTERGELADAPVGKGSDEPFPSSPPKASPNKSISEKQIKMIRFKADEVGKPVDEIETAMGKKLPDFSSAEASAVIDRLIAMGEGDQGTVSRREQMERGMKSARTEEVPDIQIEDVP